MLAHWQAQSILEFYHNRVQLSAYRCSLTLFVEMRRGEDSAEREVGGLCTPAGQIIPRKRGVASPLPADRASLPKRQNNRRDAAVCVCVCVCVCAGMCVCVCDYLVITPLPDHYEQHEQTLQRSHGDHEQQAMLPMGEQGAVCVSHDIM